MANEYFKQINLSFPDISTDDIKGELVVEHIDKGTNTGIRYWKLKDRLLNQCIIDMFASIGLYNPIITYAEVDRNIWLHRDINGTVVINHYIDTPEARTIFYEPKENYSGIAIDGNTIYEQQYCIKQTEFIAQPNSSYILDVSSIHSVTLRTYGVRKFLSIGFTKWTYSKLIEHLGTL